MSQDTIADLLSSLRNAYALRKNEIKAPFSQFNLNLSGILVKAGYLSGVDRVSVRKGVEELVIKLNRTKEKSKMINNVCRLSKLGTRQYSSVEDLAYHNRRLGIVIVSTSKGLMTTKEAIKNGLGGELICRVW